MENVKSNIQLMRVTPIANKFQPPTKPAEPIDLMSANLSSMNCSPWFKSLLYSKINSKLSVYADMKKKAKTTSANYTNQPCDNFIDPKPSVPVPDQLLSQHKINMLRNNSILEVDFLPVYFESASEGTILDSNDSMQLDQLLIDRACKIDSLHQFPGNPLTFLMEERNSQPDTPKTTPVITTQTTPMHDSPINSPLPSMSPNKSGFIESPNILLSNNSNDQRLKYSLQTNCHLNVPRMCHLVVNRLHANARRHIILNLRQWSVITDIVIPSCDKLQKIIVRVGPTNKEEEMHTIIVHSNIIVEPLLLLNIQPEIICHYIQIIIIAKSNITAERSRINIGTIYGRPALMSWEIPSHDPIGREFKICTESVNQILDYLLPRAETISMHYAIASESLSQLLQKLSRSGINQQMLSDTLPDYAYHHHGKSGYQFTKQIDKLKLLNQINSMFHKCCQLQQQISVVNNHINKYRAYLREDPPHDGLQPMATAMEDEKADYDNCDSDKLKVIIEMVLESLLLDKNAWVGVDNLDQTMDLISGITTNLMMFGNRDMQVIYYLLAIIFIL